MRQELQANCLLADDFAKHFIRILKRRLIHTLERDEHHGMLSICSSQGAISCAAASPSKQDDYRNRNSPQKCRQLLSNIVHIRHVISTAPAMLTRQFVYDRPAHLICSTFPCSLPLPSEPYPCSLHWHMSLKIQKKLPVKYLLLQHITGKPGSS